MKVSGDHEPVHYPQTDEAGGVQDPLNEAHVLRQGFAEVRSDGPWRWVPLPTYRPTVQGHLRPDIATLTLRITYSFQHTLL